MKKIFKSLALGFMAVGLFSACSEETFETVNQAGLPQADQIDAVITVDQTTNQVTMKLNNPGVYPVWKVYTKAVPIISTRQEYRDIITVAGTYQVEVQMGNRNGVCEGSKLYEFTIENTLVDFGPYMQRLTGGDTKEWKFNADERAHLGCGPSGTDGTEWWSAGPNEKAGCGFYDNRFTFGNNGGASTGTYVYDPGTSGAAYFNAGVNDLPPYSNSNPGDGNDYMAPTERQETSFEIKAEGTGVYLTFPAGTLLGYVPYADAVNDPKFRIIDIKADRLELVADNGDIAWHYLLCTLGEPAFSGFVYNSEYNLWLNATKSEPTFWYAPGWNQIADPDYEATATGYTVSLPSATTDKWQAQMAIQTDIMTSSASTYDFSVILTSNTDHNGITVKLTNANDDAYYFDEQVKVKANEEVVLYMSDMPGLDIDGLKFVFDFGGCAENTVIGINNIVIKDHANDDGTKLPDPTVVPDPTWNLEGDLNLWNGASWINGYYYAPGWNQLPDPVMTESGRTFKLELPSATYDQWQAQFNFQTDIASSSANHYDFRVTINSNNDVKVTVKLTKHGDDNTFYFADRVNVKAYEEYVYKGINMEGIDMENVDLVFDFGGNPDNTVVEISDIIFQVHQD